VRRLTALPFAVNLFAPLPQPSSARVDEWAALLGVAAPPIPGPPPRFEDQLAVVLEERVPVFSFTFGIPPLEGIDAITMGTATTGGMTGRHARGVHRPLIDRLEASGVEPPDFPLPRLVFPDQLLLAGQGGPLARSLPAGELVATLAAETDVSRTGAA